MKFRFVCFLVLSLSVGVFLVGCSGSTQKMSSPTPEAAADTQQEIGATVCTTNFCRTVEIADEVTEQQHGLMGRTSLADDAGMLFTFKKLGSWQFWMKDTLIPLDMLWLDEAGTVVHMAEQVPPCGAGDACPGYGPTGAVAVSVLEVASGQAKKQGITVGSKLTISY